MIESSADISRFLESIKKHLRDEGHPADHLEFNDIIKKPARLLAAAAKKEELKE
jgi:hypothetical protein